MEEGGLKMFFVCFESAFVLCLILLDSFVDVELERKGALLCMRLRLILFLSHCQISLLFVCLFACLR